MSMTKDLKPELAQEEGSNTYMYGRYKLYCSTCRMHILACHKPT